MEQILDGYSCNLEGYMPRALHTNLTWEDVIYAYHLFPAPPLSETGSMDDYIRKAQETHDLKYIFFYLHMNERYFNKKIVTVQSRRERCKKWLPKIQKEN